MLRLTRTTRLPHEVVLVLEGQIVAEWVDLLEAECLELLGTHGKVFLDLANVSYLDRRAVRLLREAGGAIGHPHQLPPAGGRVGKGGRPMTSVSADDLTRVHVEFEELLSPILSMAYGTAVRLTRDRTEAEDLIQDAALLAYRAFASFQPGTNFKAWFFRILTNAFYSRHRKDKHEKANISTEDVPALYLYTKTAEAGLHGQESDPASALMDKLDSEQVGAALEELPEEYRLVATLYFIEDFSYQQIADVLEMPGGDGAVATAPRAADAAEVALGRRRGARDRSGRSVELSGGQSDTRPRSSDLLHHLFRHPPPPGDLGHPPRILPSLERRPQMGRALVDLERLGVLPLLDPQERVRLVDRFIEVVSKIPRLCARGSGKREQLPLHVAAGSRLSLDESDRSQQIAATPCIAALVSAVFSSTRIPWASLSPMFSEAWVTASLYSTSPALVSRTTVRPSASVKRILNPVTTYTTWDGWTCIASFAPFRSMKSSTRTLLFSRMTR